jgi:hypothetical protein
MNIHSALGELRRTDNQSWAKGSNCTTLRCKPSKKMHEENIGTLNALFKKADYERGVTTATLPQTSNHIFKGPPTFTTQHYG